MIENIDVVVDASGTYGNHNYVGDGGLPALGERSLENDQLIDYVIPDIKKETEKFSGSQNKTLVIGCGASAITTLSSLKSFGVNKGGISVTWITKRISGENPFKVIEVENSHNLTAKLYLVFCNNLYT